MKKNLQLTFAWFILGVLSIAAALWQNRVAVAREVSAIQKPLPPPPKTRHDVRTGVPGSHQRPTYDTRRKQGLTGPQIGWIVEDFQAAGLDLGIRVAQKEDYLDERKAQDRWYRDALVEAWSLTPGQSSQITEKLGELFNQARADFIEALAAGSQPIEVNGQWLTVTSSAPIHRLIDTNTRLQDSRFMPWNLCEMTAEQNPNKFSNPIVLKITGVPEQEYKNVVTSEPIHIIAAAPSLSMVNLLLPRTAPSPAGEPLQVTWEENGILPQTNKFHPAQLKLFLLIDPEKAKEIEQALDAAGK